MHPALKCVGFLLLLSILFAGCDRQTQTPANYFQTPFQDESQFIVAAIVTDLAEMADFAAKGRIANRISVSVTEREDSQFRQPVYEIKALANKSADKTLVLNQPIWAPGLYADLARDLITDPTRPAQRADPSDLTTLLELAYLEPGTIEAENQRISSQLATNFYDPVLHELAAVILGAFALREYSDNFYDVRLPLCRMTAHLAFAQALSDKDRGYGINGRVAEVMLATLMNNQTDALQKLAALPTEPRLQPWVRALRVRNTYDYRELRDQTDLTRLERILGHAALSRGVTADAGWDQLSPEMTSRASDASRIAYGESYSVELGHQLLESSLRLELTEIAKLQQLLGRKAARETELVEFLNEIPEGSCVDKEGKVRIIGPGQWAAFLQRHLCHALQHNFTFLHNKWGVPEEARKFTAIVDEKFGALRLYPFVRRFHARTEKEYQLAVDQGMPITIASPHLVPPEAWLYLSSPPKFATRYWPGSHPHVNEWHKHNPPPGTAYHLRPRFYQPSLMNRPDTVTVLGQLHNLAPFDAQLANTLLHHKYHDAETYQQAEEILRPLLEYSATQNFRLAQKALNDAVEYETVMNRYAEMNPNGYFDLGRYFANRKQFEKAAAYYEQGTDLATDEVTMSNNCGWLVRYYHSQGNLAKATALADRAAEVYSSAGLRTKAELMELEKNYDEALEYYRRMEERYKQSGPLVGFCVRYKATTADSRFDPLVAARLKTLFPRGLEEVGLQDFQSAPPQEGVSIAEENELIKNAGLKQGDIIVALDGLRVYDMTQYLYVRELTNAPLRLIVWSGAAYVEKESHPPNRRFGVPFNDFSRTAK